MCLPRCRIWGRPKPSSARPQTRCRTLVARGCPAAYPCAPAASPGASFSVTAAWLDWNAEDSVHVSIISLTEIMQWMWVHTLSFPPPGASLPLFCPFRLRRWRASGISSAHPSVSLISGTQMMMLWKTLDNIIGFLSYQQTERKFQTFRHKLVINGTLSSKVG